jgi:hypothetical protein
MGGGEEAQRAAAAAAAAPQMCREKRTNLLGRKGKRSLEDEEVEARATRRRCQTVRRSGRGDTTRETLERQRESVRRGGGETIERDYCFLSRLPARRLICPSKFSAAGFSLFPARHLCSLERTPDSRGPSILNLAGEPRHRGSRVSCTFSPRIMPVGVGPTVALITHLQ